VNIADGKVGRKGQHRGKDEEGTREKAARSTRRSGTMIEHSSLTRATLELWPIFTLLVTADVRRGR